MESSEETRPAFEGDATAGTVRWKPSALESLTSGFPTPRPLQFDAVGGAGTSCVMEQSARRALPLGTISPLRSAAVHVSLPLRVPINDGKRGKLLLCISLRAMQERDAVHPAAPPTGAAMVSWRRWAGRGQWNSRLRRRADTCRVSVGSRLGPTVGEPHCVGAQGPARRRSGRCASLRRRFEWRKSKGPASAGKVRIVYP